MVTDETHDATRSILLLPLLDSLETDIAFGVRRRSVLNIRVA
jgi:hypothetical protein